MTALLTAAGHPVPPTDIVRRLRQLRPDLAMRWYPSSQVWGFTADWPPTDARWARVQAGEVSPDEAHDAICFAPREISADDAYHYLVRNLRTSSRDDLVKLLDGLATWNEAQSDANAEKATAETLNEIEVMGHTLTGTAKQYQNAPSGERKGHFGKGRKSVKR